MSRYQFNHTVRFAFWNAEESGMDGSAEYVTDASENAATIPLYMNYDSPAYDPDDRYVLDVMYNEESHPFADLMADDNSVYGIDFDLTFNAHDCGSDHVSFWEAGYPAIATHSQSHAPQVHSPDDTVDLISSTYAKKSAQLGMVILAETADCRTRTVASSGVPLPGEPDAPADPNGDGTYRDANGNGEADFTDVVLYVDRMTWIGANAPVPAFDGRGPADPDDAVRPFDTL